MSRKTAIIIAAALGLIAILAAGAVAFAYLRPTAQASGPISAVPITAFTATAAEAAAQTQPTATSAAQAAADPTATTAAVDEPTTAAPEATQAPAQAQSETGAGILFEIIPDQSQARFSIGEILNGSPKTVVGITDQVSGQILVDVQNPANTRVGVIQVNARTLSTDNEFRNRAIKNRILLTDQHEFITFTPAAVSGLPASAAVNQPFQFQITGDLTIAGVTKSVTFDAEVTPTSETELRGFASTEVDYADFGISIPNVQSVTGVDDNVILEIEFTAVQK